MCVREIDYQICFQDASCGLLVDSEIPLRLWLLSRLSCLDFTEILLHPFELFIHGVVLNIY